MGAGESNGKLSTTLGIVLIVLTVILSLGLLTYDCNDLSFWRSPSNRPVRNAVGLVGAWSSHFLFLAFGFGAYALPVIVFCWGLFILIGGTRRTVFGRISRAVLGILVLLGLSTVFSIWPYIQEMYMSGAAIKLDLTKASESVNLINPGGAVGVFVIGKLIPYLGVIGSFTIGATVLVVSVFWLTGAGLWHGMARGLHGGSRAVWKGVFESRRLFKLRRATGGGAAPARKIRVKRYRPGEEKEEEEVVRKPRRRAPRRAAVKREKVAPPARGYPLPRPGLLEEPPPPNKRQLEEDIEKNKDILQGTLADFGLEVKCGEVTRGPVITRYEIYPAPGVKVQKITALSEDLALAMKAVSIRIAPIPGKATVGVEIPNRKTTLVYLKDMIESKEFDTDKKIIPLCIGKDLSGRPIIPDLVDMPHLLIAGATGSGKTVSINAIIMSILFHSTPEKVKLFLVDPKRVEMSQYQALPHLVAPIIKEHKKAAAGLNWVVAEMERRYEYFSRALVRNIAGYNKKMKLGGGPEEGDLPGSLPYIVVVIDELADLMMSCRKEVEDPIIRLAQMGRAAGVHIVLATQRPSVNVITGLIKANFPTRIAFQVASRVDSKVIIDTIGADKLLGKGDMIFIPPGTSRRVRSQGTLVFDSEIQRVVDSVIEQAGEYPRDDIFKQMEAEKGREVEVDDELFDDALEIIKRTGHGSVSLLQRRLRIGYTRAARLMDFMEAKGIVGPYRGSKAREVLIETYAEEKEE
ncbi:MAG: DNA translocase FtsK [Candidatus Tritonobacter lacicola]|nr:DNA translocase FtsK [Candidatus Tritonobacter lacicola]